MTIFKPLILHLALWYKLGDLLVYAIPHNLDGSVRQVASSRSRSRWGGRFGHCNRNGYSSDSDLVFKVDVACYMKKHSDEFEFERYVPIETQAQFQPIPCKDKPLPVLVVGATGKIGRLVVEQLLAKDIPTRALVRNYDRAVEILGEDTVKSRRSLLEVVVGDVYDEEVLERAIKGCGSVVSLMGRQRRITHFLDLLPWRLFSTNICNVEKWSNDKTHPYFANFLAQKKIVKFAERHHLMKIVRITNRNVGLSSLDIRTILHNLAYSMVIKYQCLGEQVIMNSTIPSLIIRPDQLTDDERDNKETFIQVDTSGLIPSPSIISRSDIAALILASIQSEEDKRSYTIATRWVGKLEGKQFAKESRYLGKMNAVDCINDLKCDELAHIFDKQRRQTLRSNKMRPYSSGVGMIVYTPLILLLKCFCTLSKLKKLYILLPKLQTTLAYGLL